MSRIADESGPLAHASTNNGEAAVGGCVCSYPWHRRDARAGTGEAHAGEAHCGSTQTSIIMSNKGRIPASGLDAMRPEAQCQF